MVIRRLIKISEDDLSVAVIDMIAVIGDLLGNHRNNWGLNIFEESKLLFDETEEGESARYEALKVIAHSQAHNVNTNCIILFALLSYTCKLWNTLSNKTM